MKVMILMAGRGTRFSSSHPETPKPLIPLHGEPLVRWVVENLKIDENQEFIFVALKEHVTKYSLHQLFSSWKIRFQIVEVDHVTEGAACSALLAKDLIKDTTLIIANSDQFILYDKSSFYSAAQKSDGLIMTMKASGTKWSYVKEEHGLITEVREKQPISDRGTVGVYYFGNSSDFVSAAEEMIRSNDRYNNEFYLAPVYNYLIKRGLRIRQYDIGKIDSEMIGLGTSEDFLNFEADPISLQLARKLWP